jgi:tetratricopeptide (TPR) repeat protein
MLAVMFRWSLTLALVFNQLLATPATPANQQPQAGNTPNAQSQAAAREEAYRANNLGVALLEQFKYAEGAVQFRRALQLDSTLTIARINLAIALYNVPDLEASLREAKAAAALLPDAPQPYYILGLIARAQNRVPDAIAAFERVLQIDNRDVGANVNLSQIYLQTRDYARALPLARAAFEAEPYNVTAAYILGTALIRGGHREDGQKMMARFQSLREGGYGTKIDKDYLDQGKYAEAVSSTGAESELVEPATPNVSFIDSTAVMMPARTGANGNPAETQTVFNRRFAAAQFDEAARNRIVADMGGSAVLFDYDGDGDLDLFETGRSGQRLYRNDGGKFVEVTEQSGLGGGKPLATGVVAGDYDNDTKPDLFVLRYGASSLYHNDGNGHFTDVTAAVGIPAYPFLSISAAFVDVDHDGDLDIFIAGFADLAKAPAAAGDKILSFPSDFPGAPNLLLRNNGNGTFTDITAAAKVTGSLGHAVAVVPTDFDNRRDVDLLVVNFHAVPTLFRNMRDGSFADVALSVGLGGAGDFTSAAACDVNKDGYTDFYLGAAGGPGVLALSDGRERFSVQPAPSASEQLQGVEQDVAQFVDYDDDGLADLVRLSFGVSGGALQVWRNVGGRWNEVTDRATQKPSADSAQPAVKLAPRVLASGDIDGDGDTDLVVRAVSGEIRILRNNGGNANQVVRVRLVGKVSNRSGVGSKVEVRAGSLRQKLETYAASPAPAPVDITFGLGRRQSADAVRVLWPSGVVQAETDIPKAAGGRPAQPLVITELDRKPSSCPYLYTWNGQTFEFITDFMGGGEMGYWEGPGERNHPDPVEYVRIRDDQLKERDGRFDIRVTNELEEALYVDRLQLIAIAHPSDVEIYPNEGMVEPPRPFKLFITRDARPPASATDEHGHDVLARISKQDRTYPDDFGLKEIRGYAEEHSLTLDLGSASGPRMALLLTAWTDYAFSSDNVAAHQAGLSMKPPSLQVKNSRGRWKTVIEDIGIPVGRPQTVTVDLTGKFLSNSREVRLVTNMRIYWDRILVDTSSGTAPVRKTRLDPSKAELRRRGFSAETTPDGREPFSYDYNRVTSASPWKTMPGRYTREGDVRELLLQADDMFVISLPGDEIAVSFDATGLSPLPRGWKRTFLLYADGFSKEMDINSASPDQVLPLPFHGMTRYPYSAPEHYPMTPARRAYYERYNTRVVREELPGLDAAILEEKSPRINARSPR